MNLMTMDVGIFLLLFIFLLVFSFGLRLPIFRLLLFVCFQSDSRLTFNVKIQFLIFKPTSCTLIRCICISLSHFPLGLYSFTTITFVSIVQSLHDTFKASIRILYMPNARQRLPEITYSYKTNIAFNFLP